MNEVDRNAKLLWNYNQMHHQISASDAILALGSMDARVAERAAELWHQGIADTIVVSGGFGRLTGIDKSISEADTFHSILLNENVPKSVILVENTSTNTADNILFSVKKLEQAGKRVKKITVVTQPYAEKRTYATVRKLMPDIESLHTSPQLTYEEYPEGEITKDLLINTIVGDTQRIKQYPQTGYTITMPMSKNIEDAMDYLIREGFSHQLIKSSA